MRVGVGSIISIHLLRSSSSAFKQTAKTMQFFQAEQTDCRPAWRKRSINVWTPREVHLSKRIRLIVFVLHPIKPVAAEFLKPRIEPVATAGPEAGMLPALTHSFLQGSFLPPN